MKAFLNAHLHAPLLFKCLNAKSQPALLKEGICCYFSQEKPQKHIIMIEAIKKLIEDRDALAKQAVKIYEPIVQQYIATNCQDSNQICYTLDFMLSFCFDDQMLLLYRKLCRHFLLSR